jgi:hypothetical protein
MSLSRCGIIISLREHLIILIIMKFQFFRDHPCTALQLSTSHLSISLIANHDIILILMTVVILLSKLDLIIIVICDLI